MGSEAVEIQSANFVSDKSWKCHISPHGGRAGVTTIVVGGVGGGSGMGFGQAST